MSRPFGGRQRLSVPGRRAEIAFGVLGVDAEFDRATGPSAAAGANDSRSPAATRNCSATRSMPVTISVTGCSTWMRVFISMKKKLPLATS